MAVTPISSKSSTSTAAAAAADVMLSAVQAAAETAVKSMATGWDARVMLSEAARGKADSQNEKDGDWQVEARRSGIGYLDSHLAFWSRPLRKKLAKQPQSRRHVLRRRCRLLLRHSETRRRKLRMPRRKLRMPYVLRLRRKSRKHKKCSRTAWVLQCVAGFQPTQSSYCTHCMYTNLNK